MHKITQQIKEYAKKEFREQTHNCYAPASAAYGVLGFGSFLILAVLFIILCIS